MSESLKLALSVLLGGLVLLVPLVAQIFGAAWYLRRNIEKSKGQRLSWIDLQGLAFAFNIVCSAAEGLALWVVLRLTAAMHHYLGYVGFGLLALVMGYAAISLASGIFIATGLWWIEKDSPKS